MSGSPRLLSILTAERGALRDTPFEEACAGFDLQTLLGEAAALDRFRRREGNLYRRVRALAFLAAMHRFELPARLPAPAPAAIPWEGVEAHMGRDFGRALDVFLAAQDRHGPSDAVSSALAASYRELAFQTLKDQVRESVRAAPGNAWMFQVGRPAEQPLRVRPGLAPPDADRPGPWLEERTPVRMDLSHAAWSDIFFLAMDDPEAARVLNVSIDLAVRGRDERPEPPIHAGLRVIPRPVLRLASVDLDAEVEISDVAEVFDFARDHLGLLKAAVVAAGVVPPGLERSGGRLADVFLPMLGPRRGLEITSFVRGIPKGSRLAVSTNLLASLIALCMRATGQTAALEGPLREEERRVVVGRAILGEWLGGSGGGWQDSAGLWPSIKLITGALAAPGDPEFGVSRGRLLPEHRALGEDEAGAATLAALQRSLVLVHGGLAQDVGPILEMVTEKYLLRRGPEWQARREAGRLFDAILAALARGDVAALGRLTQQNFEGPIQTIIPAAGNAFTDRMIEAARECFGDAFWGFWMLGGMAGGGMGFLFDPALRRDAAGVLAALLRAERNALADALPFAMEPVVYEFEVDATGSRASLHGPGPPSRDPTRDAPAVPAARLADGDGPRDAPRDLDGWLARHGFDARQHEEVREALRRGGVGLARNRLPAHARVEDARPDDVLGTSSPHDRQAERGRAALEEGTVAVVTLAGGSGSRWTQGAGTVKALHPFWKRDGAWRSFLDVHRARLLHAARAVAAPPPHVLTTSYLTHGPLLRRLAGEDVVLSAGRSIGRRLVPMERDLRFLWEETAQQRLDEPAQRVQDSLRAALLAWAKNAGEGADYRDNLPLQCLHPTGHFYEVPNLLVNGTLRRLLHARPRLRTLLVHNVDTLGAGLDPALLGRHLEAVEQGAAFTFEVVPRRFEDRGGGLARVDGRLRLVESLALPREQDQFDLRWYSSMTNWVDVDRLLALFGLTRETLHDRDRVAVAIRDVARRLPTYVTLKDVKKRWGHGQEDVFPVAQWEKLWGDVTALDGVECRYVAVDRVRGQQLKEPSQLDAWLQDGSADAVAAACGWE